ncbi:hypothetical protein [Lentzea jiangxiensis]|uniref:Uncharacterized protein n=1 Tax=Lentzea jiangxiensis TaxID=641025 RepID=A0A1H0NAK1_9PSEU|nr:hypothetical protein [Lentzea jiangxiensis]SDO89764.1 hypothetical protein SAMN05421507_104339 [Lentzea jiangxiensis]
MDKLIKGLLDLLTDPIFLTMIAGAVVAALVRRWWQFRSHRAARAEQISALNPLAARLGGTVISAEQGDTAAWSAGFLEPVKSDGSAYDTVLKGKWLRRSKPQWDLAMDFRRGDWHVRVTEAAVRIAAYTGYGVRWEQEHRVEVATAPMAPMRMARPKKYTADGRPIPLADFEKLWDSWLSEPPATVRSRQAAWQRVQLPSPMDQEFFVWGSDPSAVVRDLNFTALHWLIDHEEHLPPQAHSMRLTFEAGVVYIVMDHHIDQAGLMAVVDMICGLLDRMPGARPRHPAAAV